MRGVYETKSKNILINFVLNINAVFAKVLILGMIEKWWEALDKGGLGDALLAEVPKDFYFI